MPCGNILSRQEMQYYLGLLLDFVGGTTFKQNITPEEEDAYVKAMEAIDGLLKAFDVLFPINEEKDTVEHVVILPEVCLPGEQPKAHQVSHSNSKLRTEETEHVSIRRMEFRRG